jgi:hypothetical protein
MRNTLLASAAALALTIAVPALAQTPSNPLPAKPSDVTNGNPSAGTPSGLPPGQSPSTTSHLTPSANAMPGSAPNGANSSPAMGEGAVPADQGAAAAPPSNQPATNMSADQSPAPAQHARKWHRAHSETAGDDDSGHWAHQPGTGESGPASTRASNIDSADTRSDIAPHLPMPAVGDSASPSRYLRDAERALQSRHTGEAQQALEMAETRLLDRSTPAADANQIDERPAIEQVTNARKALASGDIQGARQAIQTALADRQRADSGTMNNGYAMGSSPSAMQPARAPAPNGGAGNVEAGHVIGAGTGGGPLGTPSQDSAGGAR